MPISADLATVAATDVRPKTSASDAVGGVQNSDADFAATYERERQAQSAAGGDLPESAVQASGSASEIQSVPAAESLVDDEALLASSEGTEASDEESIAPDTTAVQELLLPLDLTSVTPPLPSAQASVSHDAALITKTSADLAADGVAVAVAVEAALPATAVTASSDSVSASLMRPISQAAAVSETPVAGRQTDGAAEADPVTAANTAPLLARTLGSSTSAAAPDASVTANMTATEVETTPAALLERGILAARMAQASGQTGLPSAPNSGAAGTASAVTVQSSGLPSGVGALLNASLVTETPLAGDAVLPAQTSGPVVVSASRDVSTASAAASQLAGASVGEAEALSSANTVAPPSPVSTSAPVVSEAESALSAKPMVAGATEAAIISPSAASGAAASTSHLADAPRVAGDSQADVVAPVSSAPSVASSTSVLASRLAGSSVEAPESAPSSAQAVAPVASAASAAVSSSNEVLPSSSASALPSALPAAANAVLVEVEADIASVVAPVASAATSAVPPRLSAKPSSTLSPSSTDSPPTAKLDLQQDDAQSVPSTLGVPSATSSDPVEATALLEPTRSGVAEDSSLAESSPERAPDTSLSSNSKEAQSIPSTPRLPVVVGQPLALQKSEWSQAAVDRVMWMSSQNLQSAEIRLDPAELGRMEVRIDMVKDQAQVTFMSAQAGVRDAVESQLPRLRELFSQQGMNLLDVNVSDQSSSGAWQGSSEQGRGQRHSMQDSLTAIESDEAVFGTMDASTSRKDSTRSLVDYYA